MEFPTKKKAKKTDIDTIIMETAANLSKQFEQIKNKAAENQKAVGSKEER